MIFRPSRDQRAGPLLEWKVRLFVVGAGLGLAGIFLDSRWLTGAAIAVLAGGALLRFLPGAVGEEDALDGPGDAPPGDGPGRPT